MFPDTLDRSKKTSRQKPGFAITGICAACPGDLGFARKYEKSPAKIVKYNKNTWALRLILLHSFKFITQIQKLTDSLNIVGRKTVLVQAWKKFINRVQFMAFTSMPVEEGYQKERPCDLRWSSRSASLLPVPSFCQCHRQLRAGMPNPMLRDWSSSGCNGSLQPFG